MGYTGINCVHTGEFNSLCPEKCSSKQNYSPELCSVSPERSLKRRKRKGVVEDYIQRSSTVFENEVL